MTFAPGETGPKQVEIEIIDDPDVESTEGFKVRLESLVPAVKSGDDAVVNILDNDGNYAFIYQCLQLTDLQ